MNFVTMKLKKRENEMLKKKNMTIDIDSRVADLLTSSQMISGNHNCTINRLVSKGKSHKLLRKALLKDKRDELELNTKMLKEMSDQVPTLKEEIYNLKLELDKKDDELREREGDAEILSKLFEKGLIDENGDIIEKDDF